MEKTLNFKYKIDTKSEANSYTQKITQYNICSWKICAKRYKKSLQNLASKIIQYFSRF